MPSTVEGNLPHAHHTGMVDGGVQGGHESAGAAFVGSARPLARKVYGSRLGRYF
jgi:hypothetical protein